MTRNETHVIETYRRAEEAIREAGYAWEIEWQRSRSFERFTEQELLRESAWVILCSGFREASVRKCFDVVSLCFCDWESAEEITSYRDQCITTALSAFRHERKISAIAHVAQLITTSGFDGFRSRIVKDPIPALQELPFIGPVTSWHLAKNLGLDVAKNDRHLARLALHFGYSDAHTLCDFVAHETGEIRSVVDVIFWRFAALNRDHAQLVA